MKKSSLALIAITSVVAGSLQAATIIEPGTGGLLQGNYFYLPSGGATSLSTPGTALGLSGVQSIYGGNGAYDEYVFQFTPGTDPNNFSPAAGTDLGNGDLASGLAGGASGIYNIYFTWPDSDNISGGGSDIWLIAAGDSTELLRVNDVITDSNKDGLNVDPVAPGDTWWKVGSANLTQGVTYELHIQANNATFVSQRASGVLFDYQAVPEPSAIALGLLGGFGVLVTCMRRRISS